MYFEHICSMAGSIENRLSELGIELPKVAKLLAIYIPFVVTGNLVFVPGQLPMWNGELMLAGKLGDNIPLTDGQAAAGYYGVSVLMFEIFENKDKHAQFSVS